MASTTPKVTLTKEQRECATPAQMARLLGVDGKRLRDVLRKQGIYVSKGHAFDDAAKAIVVARFTKQGS